MSSSRDLVDLSGLSSDVESGITSKSDVNKQNYKGVAGNKLIEPVPNYIDTPSEKVIKNENNAWIVLGRDRPSNRFSGYSGKGATGAGSVDIVVGRASTTGPKEVDEETGEPVYADPNFKTDAARIHVSQKTDIDDNFGLAEGNVGNAKAKSGVGIKADGVRLVGREGVKIVTGTDAVNSQGGKVGTVKGIDLIAGNDDSKQQPLVKGDNLVELIGKIIDKQNSLAGMLESFLTAQMNFNNAIATHSHPGPGAPSPVAAIAGASSSMTELLNSFMSSPIQRMNRESLRMNYCKPIGEKYINSRHNTTN